MPGRIENDPPGRIGPIGAGWSVELDAMPHSATQGSGSTGVINFTALADYDAHLVLNNKSTFYYGDDSFYEVPDVSIGPSVAPPPGPDPAYGYLGYGDGFYGGYDFGGAADGANPAYGLGGFSSQYYSGVGSGYNTGVYGGSGLYSGPSGTTSVYEPRGDLSITAVIDGAIDSVSLQGNTGTFTQGTNFTQFATPNIDIPAVTSGSPVAAFDLAWQLAGNNPCSYTDARGAYWPLRGHDTGFDSKNKALIPKDASNYKLTKDAVAFRKWAVTDSYASTGWDVADGEFWSTSGVGSSVATEATKHTVIVATTTLHGRSLVMQFGTSTSSGFEGFGPDDSAAGTGKWFTLSLHGTTAAATLSGQYRAGGSYVTVSKIASLTGIDTASPVQMIVDVGYPSSKAFILTVYLQNVDSTDPPVVLTTGTLTTAVDVFAAPWKVAGYLHGLYVASGSYDDLDATDYLGGYENWDAQPLCDIARYGIGSPILPFNGSLWDYLTQVCVARQVGLRLLSGRFSMSAMTDDGIHAQVWSPAASPTFSLDNSSAAASVEVDAQFTALKTAPRIYDAADKGESYSVTPGTTAQFSINTTSVNGLVYNPEPVFDVGDYLNGSHPYGAYVVSGPDNLPILVSEWVSYGGSVSVEQAGLNTLSVTVVCPDIPLGLTQTGDYSLAVSDGSTSHPMLRLVSPSGGAVVDNKIVFQTGSSFSGSNTAASTITNVAATDAQSLQNCATWAIVQATGPNINLNGEFPLSDLRFWQSSDFGIIPGSTILYRNLQWRILVSTITNTSVQFTAAPYVTYQSDYFGQNWDGFTVDDYAQFWDGKNYDDMAVMPLAGPNYDWDSNGAVARYSLYPGAGTLASDPGLDPSTTLLPSPFLDPDAPGFADTQTSGHVYPEAETLYPGSEEDQE